MMPRIPLSRLFAILLLAPVAACGDDGTGPGSPAALEVTSVAPASGTSTVETGATVQAEFNQEIDPASLTPNSFTVARDGTPLASAVRYDAGSRTGTLVAPLLPGEVYDAEITTGVRTPADSSLSDPEAWLFSTRPWEASIADDGGGDDVGLHTSLALDGDGSVHVTYQDVTNDHLEYATCADACASGTGWDTLTVDSGGNVGESTSLAIDGDGGLHVSYHDVGNTALKYATCASDCGMADSWQTLTVDSDGTVGTTTSLVIGGSGQLHVAYRDETNADLKYATCASDCTTPESWESTTADSDGDVGAFASLALDATGRLHASYEDGTNEELKYATCANSCSTQAGWETTLVESDAAGGRWTSLEVDGSGRLHVIHRDFTDTRLEYATCGSNCTAPANWQTVTADDDGNVGSFADLALDANGRLHVVHFDSGEGDVRYSTCAANCTLEASWQGKAAVAVGIIGFHPSLAVDENGRIRVSYYDQTNGALAYAE